MEQKLGPLVRRRLKGTERLHRQSVPLGPTVLQFWQWAGSDLVGNTFRGCLAEFLVATDLGICDDTRREWEGCDLQTPEGVRIEVKASGYIQSWNQKQLSVPRFSIRCARAWDPLTNTLSAEVARHSDVYVFSLHYHKNKATVDPLDVSQWTFFVAPTKRIDERFRMRTSLTLPEVRGLGAVEAAFGGIASAIRAVLANNAA